MIKKLRNKIVGKVQKVIGSAVRSEIENALPLIPQMIEFQNSAKEDRQSFYDHTKDPLGSIGFYGSLKDRLLSAGVPVQSVDIDIPDFERWLNDFPEIRRYYEKMEDVFIEKCLEHYLTFRHLNISAGGIYIDVASAGSPWARILKARAGRFKRQKTDKRDEWMNRMIPARLDGREPGSTPVPSSRASGQAGQEDRDRKRGDRKGVKAYRLDLSFPKGINGIDIGADAGDTKLRDNFATVLSLQCAYECFMGDADMLFVEEASRILNKNGRYGIAPLYLADIHFVSTSPYCNQAEVIIEPEARKVWRDDEYKVQFSRNYSPESFAERIYSRIPEDMEGKVFYFKNLDEVMRYYPGQRIYCFFMFLCEKPQQ